MGSFFECIRLSSIRVPNRVSSIQSMAFFNCYHLDCIQWETNNNNNINIGFGAFHNCPINRCNNNNFVSFVENYNGNEKGIINGNSDEYILQMMRDPLK